MLDSTKTLTIVGETNQISFKPNENLLELLNASKISINQSCGGNGSCTTCRVLVHSPSSCFSARTELGTEIAIERSFEPHERLACQTELLDSATIEIPLE